MWLGCVWNRWFCICREIAAAGIHLIVSPMETVIRQCLLFFSCSRVLLRVPPLALNSQLFSKPQFCGEQKFVFDEMWSVAKGWCWQVAAADAWTEKMNGCVGRSSSKDSIQEQRRTTWHNLNLGCSGRREKMRNKRQSGVVTRTEECCGWAIREE